MREFIFPYAFDSPAPFIRLIGQLFCKFRQFVRKIYLFRRVVCEICQKYGGGSRFTVDKLPV